MKQKEIYEEIKEMILDVVSAKQVQEQLSADKEAAFNYFMGFVDLVIERLLLQFYFFDGRKISEDDAIILGSLTEYSDILMFFNLNETWNTIREKIIGERFLEEIDKSFSTYDKVYERFGLALALGTMYVNPFFDSCVKLELNRLFFSCCDGVIKEYDTDIKNKTRAIKSGTDFIELVVWKYVNAILGR